MKSFGLCRTTVYPWIRAATKGGAEILFLDEAGIRSDAVLGKTWAFRGKTPTVPTSGLRQAASAISAVNSLGAFWYEVYTGTLNAERFVGFLKSLLRGRRKPI